MARHVVARISEIAPGSRKLFTIAGRPIVVFNIRGEFFALLNRCPHQGASLADGLITGFVNSSKADKYCYEREGEVIRCPWHGWEFDIMTGQSWFDPAKTKVKSYKAQASSGSELVQGPYKAESFPVSLEEEYVVVDV
jgi:nitrite reductase/ring-hydroxylating ferredoxin subunit